MFHTMHKSNVPSTYYFTRFAFHFGDKVHFFSLLLLPFSLSSFGCLSVLRAMLNKLMASLVTKEFIYETIRKLKKKQQERKIHREKNIIVARKVHIRHLNSLVAYLFIARRNVYYWAPFGFCQSSFTVVFFSFPSLTVTIFSFKIQQRIQGDAITCMRLHTSVILAD